MKKTEKSENGEKSSEWVKATAKANMDAISRAAHNQSILESQGFHYNNRNGVWSKPGEKDVDHL